MMRALFITGVIKVDSSHATRKANEYAAFTGFTGFAGFRACDASNRYSSKLSSIKISSPLTCANNHANHVNPVTSYIQQGFQRSRVAVKVCKTLINGVFHG